MAEWRLQRRASAGVRVAFDGERLPIEKSSESSRGPSFVEREPVRERRIGGAVSGV